MGSNERDEQRERDILSWRNHRPKEREREREAEFVSAISLSRSGSRRLLPARKDLCRWSTLSCSLSRL